MSGWGLGEALGESGSVGEGKKTIRLQVRIHFFLTFLVETKLLQEVKV